MGIAPLLVALGVCLSPLGPYGFAAQTPAVGDPPQPTEPAPFWVQELPGLPSADGAADTDRLYVPLATGELVSLARDTGSLIWSHAYATRWPPLVIGETLLVASDTALHELEATTGTARRTIPLPAPPAGPPVALGRVLVMSLTSGVMAAFDPSGRPLWTTEPGGVSHVPAAGQDGDAVVFVALADGRLAALRGADGSVIWSRDIGGRLSAPTVRDTRVYVGSTTRAVYAFDGRTGRLLWDVATGGDVVGTTADETSLYVVSLDNVVRALHLSRGSLLWKRVPPTRPLSAPMRSGSRLLMGGVRPLLLAFDARTGEPVTTLTLPGDLELAMSAGAPIVFPETPESRVAVALVTRDRRIIGLALDPPPAAAASPETAED